MEWIKTSDRLPEKDGAYLCASKYGTNVFYRLLHFAKDLYKASSYAFKEYKGENKSGLRRI